MTIEISNLGTHTGKPANTDVLPLVDVSDTTQAASGSTKKVSYADLVTGLLTTTAAAAAYQPLDSDLTALAALTTSSFGRSLLEAIDAAAARTTLGLGTAAVLDTGTATGEIPTVDDADARYQPLDSDLTAIAALTTSAYGRSLLAAVDAAGARTLIDVDQAGTAAAQVSAHNSDTTSVHGIADTSALETATGAQAKADGAQGAAEATAAAALASHVDDTADAHNASAISIADSGALYDATDVEAALAEVKAIADTAAGGGITLEQVQDNLGSTALVAGTSLSKTYDDGAGTITLDVDAADFATAAQGATADTAYQPGDTIPLTDGGTGAQSAAVARTNLGVYSTTETDTAIDNATSVAVSKATLDANTLLKADADDTPVALAVPASRIVGRKATGGIGALTTAEVAGLFGTPDGTKFLADDGTLKAAGGGGGSGSMPVPVAVVSGDIHSSIPRVGAGGAGYTSFAQNTLHFVPIGLAAGTIDQLLTEVNASGADIYRLGLYDDSGLNRPGGLLLDAGTVSTASGGVKAIAVSHAVSAGQKWLAIVHQGATTASVLSLSSSDNGVGGGMPSPPGVFFRRYAGYTTPGVSGALPATPGALTPVMAPVPILSVRYA